MHSHHLFRPVTSMARTGGSVVTRVPNASPFYLTTDAARREPVGERRLAAELLRLASPEHVQLGVAHYFLARATMQFSCTNASASTKNEE